MNPSEFVIKEKVWIWEGPSPWYFVTVPEKESKAVKEKYGKFHRGWGSVPIQVIIGKSIWNTSMFWEKKGTYLLPIKKEIRINENITNGSKVNIKIKIRKEI